MSTWLRPTRVICRLLDCFDRILADVPCSGTGTLARNPEIKWRLKPEDLRDLQSRQVAILKSALAPACGSADGSSIPPVRWNARKMKRWWKLRSTARRNSRSSIVEGELEQLRQSGEVCWERHRVASRGTLSAGQFPACILATVSFAAMIER